MSMPLFDSQRYPRGFDSPLARVVAHGRAGLLPVHWPALADATA